MLLPVRVDIKYSAVLGCNEWKIAQQKVCICRAFTRWLSPLPGRVTALFTPRPIWGVQRPAKTARSGWYFDLKYLHFLPRSNQQPSPGLSWNDPVIIISNVQTPSPGLPCCWPWLPDFLEFSFRWRIKVPDQFGNCQSQVIALCQSEIVEADSADTQSNKGLIRDTTDKSLPNLVVKFLLFESIKSQISFLFFLACARWGVGTRAGFNV